MCGGTARVDGRMRRCAPCDLRILLLITYYVEGSGEMKKKDCGGNHDMVWRWQ